MRLLPESIMSGHRTMRMDRDEIAAIFEAAHAGESPVRIAARTGRHVKTIRVLLRANRKRRSPPRTASDVHATERYREVQRELAAYAGSLRPRHITATEFSESWFMQNNAAFVAAMRREHPEKEIKGRGCNDSLPSPHK